jgi:hypothetical protein
MRLRRLAESRYGVRLLLHAGRTGTTAPLELREYVECLVKSYDLNELSWENERDRYVVVTKILIKGGHEAREWLARQLPGDALRRLLIATQGAGVDEEARVRLRAELNATVAEIPVRSFIPWR